MGETCFICSHHEDSHGSSGYGDVPYCEQLRCECGCRCIAWDIGLPRVLDIMFQAMGYLCDNAEHDLGCDCVRAWARSLIYKKR